VAQEGGDHFCKKKIFIRSTKNRPIIPCHHH
jgi:hypothetical protein